MPCSASAGSTDACRVTVSPFFSGEVGALWIFTSVGAGFAETSIVKGTSFFPENIPVPEITAVPVPAAVLFL